MLLYDSHVHSTISFDGRVTIDEACQRAIARRLNGLIFTEHVEFVSADDPGRVPDLPRYQQEINQAREAYPDFSIGMGLELAFHPAHYQQLMELTQAAEWDFILASLHTVDGQCIYYGPPLTGMSPTASTARYYQALSEAVIAFPHFDVLAHVDLPRRNLSYSGIPFCYDDYAADIDQVLATLIERGQGLEINTAGLRFGLDGPQPHMSLLTRYRQLGGVIVTCGADTHSGRVGEEVPAGYEWARQAGFDRVAVYWNRQPFFIDLG